MRPREDVVETTIMISMLRISHRKPTKAGFISYTCADP